LAGPVVTAACFIEDGVHIDGINDSKQTKEEDRDAMYDVLVNHPSVHWAVTVVSHTEIDEVNILQATMNGMKRSTSALLANIAKSHQQRHFRALIDGNRVPEGMPIDSTYVIKGDSIIFSIAAASIIAKVTRDRLMHELDVEFPMYNFAQHKGYPTFQHRSLLLKHGPCRVHRASYAPVRLAMEAHGLSSLAELAANGTVAVTATKSTRKPTAGSVKKVPAAAATEVGLAVAAKTGGTAKTNRAVRVTNSIAHCDTVDIKTDAIAVETTATVKRRGGRIAKKDAAVAVEADPLTREATASNRFSSRRSKTPMPEDRASQALKQPLATASDTTAAEVAEMPGVKKKRAAAALPQVENIRGGSELRKSARLNK
jgi:ribonuclease HII